MVLAAASFGALASSDLRADILPGAGGFTVASSGGGQGRESHAWVIVPDSGVARHIVLHIPPRGASGPGGSVVPDGAVARAATIDQAPELIAAWDATVFLAFAPEAARPGESRRRVLTVTASRSPFGGGWEYDARGRLAALPSIPGSGRLLGFVASSRGLVAMTDESDLGGAGSPPADDRGWGPLTLLLLDDDTWRRMPLPKPDGTGTGAGLAPPPILAATPGGPALFIRDRTHPGLWIGTFPERGRAGPPAEAGSGVSLPDLADTDRPEWVWVPLSFDTGEAFSLTGPVFQVQGRFVLADRRGGGSLTLWSASENGTLQLARLDGLPGAFAVAPLEQSGRIVLVCPERVGVPAPPLGRVRPGELPTNLPRYEYHVREVSAVTGQVLYAGKPSGVSPVSPAEFRLLVLLLLGVTVVIMVFTLRPSGPGGRQTPLVLPLGGALAEPSRRIAAAAFDLAPAVFLASRISGVPLVEVGSIEGLLGGGGGLVLILDALGIAFLHTTVCEWLFRRSLGKALAGCEVVQVVLRRSELDGDVQPEAIRAALWRVVVRNLVVWGLAPVAFAGLTSPERRHLGDRLSGTVVIVRVSPEETPGGRDGR